MAKKSNSEMMDARYGVQLKLDFHAKVEVGKSYDLHKHLQHFPREKRLVEHG
jgi:hypothetical protein